MRAVAAILRGMVLLAATAGPATGNAPPRPQTPPQSPPTTPVTEPDVGVAVDPSEVVAGMFYHGAAIHVSAVVPRGSRVAIVGRDEGHDLSMKRKGKMLGVLWMNTGDIEFEDVPDIYLLNTSAPLAELAPPPVLAELGLGRDALAGQCVPDGQDPALFPELFRLREKDGLWAIGEGSTDVRPGESELDAALATTDFTLPAKVPAGRYEILVYAFGDAVPELIGRTEVTVRQAGVTAAITGLATEHGLLYGILAVVVAVGVGLLTGVVFGLGSKGGH